MRRCSHVNRQTGERCQHKFKAPKYKLRVFCKAHKWQHNRWEKTRIIVRNSNRQWSAAASKKASEEQ